MIILLIGCALIIFVPVVLALGVRAEGHDVIRELSRALGAIPELLRDGTGRACREAWSRFRETLRLGWIRGEWVQQSVAAVLFTGAAFVGIAALVLNIIAALGGDLRMIPMIPDGEVGNALLVLTGLEMGMACLIFGALLLDLLGLTDLSYPFSERNVPAPWKRYIWAFFFAGATLACGYFVFQTGLTRGGIDKGRDRNQRLVESTGLAEKPSSQDSPQAKKPQPNSASVSPNSESGPSKETAPNHLMGLAAVLAFLAGAIAVVFMIPATTLLLATPLFLAVVIPAGILWLLAYPAVLLVDRVYTFMLSIFNYILRLRGMEPVERPGVSDSPGAQAEGDGAARTNGRAPSAPESGQGSPRNSDPASRNGGNADDRQAENGRSSDPAEDTAKAGSLYEEDDESWNPIA